VREIGDRDRKRIGQFLHLRAAGVVHDAAVGCGERAFEAGLRQLKQRARRSAASDRDRESERAGERMRAERVMAEAEWTLPGAWPRLFANAAT